MPYTLCNGPLFKRYPLNLLVQLMPLISAHTYCEAIFIPGLLIPGRRYIYLKYVFFFSIDYLYMVDNFGEVF